MHRIKTYLWRIFLWTYHYNLISWLTLFFFKQILWVTMININIVSVIQWRLCGFGSNFNKSCPINCTDDTCYIKHRTCFDCNLGWTDTQLSHDHIFKLIWFLIFYFYVFAIYNKTNFFDIDMFYLLCKKYVEKVATDTTID